VAVRTDGGASPVSHATRISRGADEIGPREGRQFAHAERRKGMTEISTIIRARLDEGRAIADEDVRALLSENEKLRTALKEFNAAYGDWFSFVEGKKNDPNKETEACYRLIAAQKEATSLTEKETTND